MDSLVQYFSERETFMDFSDKTHIFDEYKGTISRYMAQTLACLIMNSRASFSTHKIMSILQGSKQLGAAVLDILKQGN
jgi:hypothetical protein